MAELDQFRTQWAGNGLTLELVRSHYLRAGWTDPFPTDGFGVAIPLAGAFRRKAQGVTQFVEPAVGIFRRADEEVTVAHPTGEPDALSLIRVDLDRYPIVDDRDWPSGALMIHPELSLKHRLLRRDVHGRAEPWLIEMRLADVVETSLRRLRGELRRPSARTTKRHRAIVAEVCEHLSATDGVFSLVDLARRVGCSPFHLSRLFKATTGMTLSQYRQSRRINEVLQRIEQGDGNLGRIATDTGFADHSHMTRTVIAHLGSCPSRLRDLFCRDVPPHRPRPGDPD